MDVNELTADELRRIADEKSSVRAIDVDGLVVHIDDEACKSWKAFRIMSRISSEVNAESMQVMIDFIELVTDVDEQTIVEHCGGDNASLESVIKTISKIITECYPKN